MFGMKLHHYDSFWICDVVRVDNENRRFSNFIRCSCKDLEENFLGLFYTSKEVYGKRVLDRVLVGRVMFVTFSWKIFLNLIKSDKFCIMSLPILLDPLSYWWDCFQYTQGNGHPCLTHPRKSAHYNPHWKNLASGLCGELPTRQNLVLEAPRHPHTKYMPFFCPTQSPRNPTHLDVYL